MGDLAHFSNDGSRSRSGVERSKTDSTLSTGSRVSQQDVHTRSYTHTQSHKLAEVGDMEDLSPCLVSGVGMDKGLGLLTCRR
jgi:hypothetical protein